MNPRDLPPAPGLVRRTPPERVMVMLRMKSDASRSGLDAARATGRVTLRSDLLMRRLVAGDSPVPHLDTPPTLPSLPPLPQARMTDPSGPADEPEPVAEPPAAPEPRPAVAERSAAPAGRLLLRRKSPEPSSEGAGLRPEFFFRCEHCGQKVDATGCAMFEATRCPACQGSLHVPGRLDHYLLREPLGEGGMGTVYRAHDDHLHRDVALKIIRRDLLRDAGTAAQFIQEARAAARLNHPNIVHIYAIGDLRGGDPYIVMELLSRLRLDTLLSGERPLPELLVLYTAYDMMRALDSARRAGVVHGDIKPANVLYNAHGQAKLIDFGLASFLQEKRGELWGTPLYMAPEKIQRRGEDWRSDQFSLGVTLWCACTGHPPFQGASATEILRSILNDPLPPLAEARPGLDPAAAAVIERMCAKNPDDRFPAYDEPLRVVKALILEHKRALQGPAGFPAGLESLEHREVG